MKQLSRELGIDRHTLERAVHRATGKPFRRLRQETLLARLAEAFLHGPNVPLKQVAFDLGFGSLRSFDRFVSSATGVTPTALRAQINTRPLGVPPRGSTRKRAISIQ
ncbi:MAG: helix-turn-helix domain-containing protein [Terriglobia bacterium]